LVPFTRNDYRPLKNIPQSALPSEILPSGIPLPNFSLKPLASDDLPHHIFLFFKPQKEEL
jgi:hypothetical protein